ncbi:uncharacterized protein LOC134231387 [Saccostrea cucullata]|uniref:uncharacterized protein LOC134231387 n=1 Tax=Saccostrea cuccullata TaxID=36930 RepID=UPI002ED21E51
MDIECKTPKLLCRRMDKTACELPSSADMKEPLKPFPPSDIILEVEGKDIHLNKQTLMERSPVFKTMFESDFIEKGKERIPLPGKKYEEFVNFLYTFYNPELVAPITEKNVLTAGSLADEYQIMDLKDKCESFILDHCKQASKNREIRIDIKTLLEYASYAENHNMTLALSLIIKLCSRHSAESLKRAKLKAKVSADTHRKILDIRCSLMERQVATSVEKGDETISELMEFAWETQDKDKMKKCEERLVAICEKASQDPPKIGTLTRETILDYIIAAERFNLERLLSSAIEVASKCYSSLIYEDKYKEISKSTQYEICTERVSLLERECTVESENNLFKPPPVDRPRHKNRKWFY